MAQISFSPAARIDVLEAKDWYDSRGMDLGSRFVAELDRTVRRMETNPRQFPIVSRDLRRARLHQFPYSLFFRMEGDACYVIACFHGSRDPRQWQGRP